MYLLHGGRRVKAGVVHRTRCVYLLHGGRRVTELGVCTYFTEDAG